MTRRLALDFVATPPRPLTAWFILAAGAILLLPVADRYADLQDTLVEQERQATRLKRNLQGTGRAPTATRARTESSRDAQWLDQARNPSWGKELGILEDAMGEEVALLQLDSDFTAGRIQLGAEAKTMDDALAYTTRLRDAGHFTSVALDGHDLRQREGQEIIGFSVSLSRPRQRPTGALADPAKPDGPHRP